MKNKDTMIDYIRWRSDLTFDKDPFRPADNLIFCQLSYIDYSGIPETLTARGKKLSKVLEEIFEKEIYVLKNLFGGEEEIAGAIMHSERYKDVVVCNYTEQFSTEFQVQFCAVEFKLPGKTSYIAFRGTDNSLVGWKEDFMLAFTAMPSQSLAAQYADKLIKNNRKYYIGGHSKGGNLAVYAASRLSPRKLARVLRVYDNDGPGFAEDIFNIESLRRIDDITTFTAPSYDLIGRIFTTPFHDKRIVKSVYKGVDAHTLSGWQFDGPDLLLCEKYDAVSDRFADILMTWVGKASEEERRKFVDEMFDVLSADGAVTVQDIGKNNVLKIVKAIADTSRGSKELVLELLKTSILKGAGNDISNTDIPDGD